MLKSNISSLIIVMSVFGCLSTLILSQTCFWLGPRLTTVQYVMYFRCCGWCRVCL